MSEGNGERTGESGESEGIMAGAARRAAYEIFERPKFTGRPTEKKVCPEIRTCPYVSQNLQTDEDLSKELTPREARWYRGTLCESFPQACALNWGKGLVTLVRTRSSRDGKHVQIRDLKDTDYTARVSLGCAGPRYFDDVGVDTISLLSEIHGERGEVYVCPERNGDKQ